MTGSVQNAEINVVHGKDGIVASLYGRIDIDSSPEVRNRLLSLFEGVSPRLITIDLSAVSHLDSAGVATLVEALKIARAHGVEMKLQGLHDRLRTLFEVTGILAVFNGKSEAIQARKAV